MPDSGNRSEDFEELYRREFDRVARAVYVAVGSRSEAMDIAQESFLRTWVSWERVGLYDQPVLFTLKVAQNLGKRSVRRLLTLKRILPGIVADVEKDDETNSVELRQDLRAALNRASPRQRWALILCDLMDFSSESAAAVLGVTPSTVRVHLARGREALRRALPVTGNDAAPAFGLEGTRGNGPRRQLNA